MLREDQELYSYRVMTQGGHAFRAYVPFSAMYDFWDHLMDLKTCDRSTVEACYFGNDGSVISLCFDAKEVVGVDTPFNNSNPVTLKMHNDKLKEHRTAHTRKKQEINRNTFSAAQSVNKKPPRSLYLLSKISRSDNFIPIFCNTL